MRREALPRLVCFTLLALFLAGSAASGVSPDLVISQVYGGGGNSGATFTHDFVELFNRGTSPVSLNGKSIQYASATSTGNFGATSTQITELPNVTLQPGQYYLVQQAQGSGGSVPIAADFVDTTPIAMSATAGKVALVNSNASLGCNGGSTPCSAAQLALIIDLVGYGNANFAEGAAAPATTNTTSALRAGNGCTDTDNNSLDFSAGAPNPRNLSSPFTNCSAPPPPPSCIPTHTISQIQGPGITSTGTGLTVTTRGIVTARVGSGFFFQSQTAEVDSDPNTSEGLFVFTGSSAPAAAAVGNLVCVTGVVAEFGRTGSPRTVTELTSPTVVSISTGNPLPSPVVFDGSLTNPNGTTDQYEKYEGMRLMLAPLLVTGATNANVNEGSNTATSTGRFYAVLTGTQTFREPGMLITDPLAASNPLIPKFDGNPEVFNVESAAQTGSTLLNPDNGATVTGITGVLHYDFGEWKVYPDPAPIPVVSGGKQMAPAPAPEASEGTVATLNFERFYNNVNDPGSDVPLTDVAYQGRLAKASKVIREIMQSPDIIACVEVENLATLQDIANKVNTDSAPSAPAYAAYLLEGNDSSGIDAGFLVKSSRVNVSSVVQEGKDEPFAGYPGELLNDRPPLVLTGSIKKPGADIGLDLTVIAVHQRSLGDVSSNNDSGVRAREKRRQQTVYLANLIQARQTANSKERIIVAGDFNAFEFSDGYVDVMRGLQGTPTSSPVLLPVNDLVNPDLTNLIGTRPLNEQYSYNFAGNNQSLDHVIVNAPALQRLTRFAHGRVNADFAESNRGDSTTAKRLSDHDPAVAYFTLPEAVNVTAQVQITRGGLLFNRALNLFTQTVTVKNIGAGALSGPVSVAVTALPAGVTLANAAGTTPDGKPYIVMTSGALAAGASVSQTFRFSRTGTQSITWTPVAYSGAF